MGLIKASINSLGSVIGDQFKEFITCPNINNDVIIQRGVVNHGEGNKNPSEEIISNGSTIAVPQGMAMMIVDNGAIKEFTSEPGTYTWDSSSEPSIFTGGLGKGIWNSIKTIGSRISYGGQTAKDQRVYFVNIKTIPSQTFGSEQPETIYDPIYGSVEITYNGEYAIKVDDPVILVTNVLGSNPRDTLTYDDIFRSTDGRNMLKSTFAQRVSDAISNIMLTNNISFNRIQGYKTQVTDQMNIILDEQWHQKYGIIVEDVALRINVSEKTREIIREMDAKIAEKTRMGQVYSDNMAGAMAAASAEAMKTAAGNEKGTMMGFMGLNMASVQANNMANAFIQPNNVQQNNNQKNNVNNTQINEQSLNNNLNQSTQETSKAKFCYNCGNPVNGKFCSNCGIAINN